MKLFVRWTVAALLALASMQAAGQAVTTAPLYLWSAPDLRLSEQSPSGNHPEVSISGGSAAWTLTPPLQSDVTLAGGDVQVVLQVTRTCDWGGFWCLFFDPRDRQATVELTNSVLGAIASTADAQLPDVPGGSPDEYIVVLSIPAAVAAPAGSTFALTVSYEDIAGLGIEVWPRRGGNTSRVELNVIEAPTLQVLKTSQVVSDPVSTVNPKSIPGAVQLYTVRVTNTGAGSADDDSLAVADAIPQNTAMYVGDVGGPGSGPIAFVDGAPASGLLYTFTGLSSDTDDVEFSNDNAATWTHDPAPDAGGYDSSITHIRVRPQGALAAAGLAGNPYFEIRFRVRVD